MLGVILAVLILAVALWIAYRNSDLVKAEASMRKQVDRVGEIAQDARRAARRPSEHLRRDAKAYAEAVREDARARFPLEDLKDWISGRVQWSALRSAGVATLADLDRVSASQLESIRGVGPSSAFRVLGAAEAARAQIDARPIPTPDANLREPGSAKLVATALEALHTSKLLGNAPTRLAERHRQLLSDQRAATKKVTLWSWLFKSGGGDARTALLRELGHVEQSARDCLSSDEAEAYWRALDRLDELRAENEDLGILIRRYAAGKDSVDRLLAQALPTVRTESDGHATQRLPLPHVEQRRLERHAVASPVAMTPTARPAAASKPRPARSRDSCWVPPGHVTTVAGYTIRGGMMYVGKTLPIPDYEYEPDPALIDPTLPVSQRNPDFDGEQMGYWPSYSGIAPECRAAYLHWLSGGRADPDANVGYVFLFFYGLERRILRDSFQGLVSTDEAASILAEVDRLLAIYGKNGSFRSYAGSFAALLKLRISPSEVADEPPAHRDQFGEVPLSLRIGLGAIVRAKQPIPVAWARAWALQHPETHLRTPARRCADEFERLFEIEYESRFGEGLLLRAPKRTLTATYHPASGAFRGSIPKIRTDIPDVTALRKPIQDLRDLVDQCTDALDSYSRWLGRNPDGAGELSALALLPQALVRESSDERVATLARRIRNAIGEEESAIVAVADLFDEWPMDRRGTIPKRECTQRVKLLWALGFGIEPDVRFGGPRLSSEGRAVVFAVPPNAPEAPSEEYGAAALLVHLSAAIAASDGDVSNEEEEQLEAHLESALHLSAPERMRLRAYMRWSLAEPPSVSGLTKRIRKLDSEQRSLVGRFLVAVACADGRIDPDEVKLLSKVYRLLDLDPARVHREIHQVTTRGERGATEPVTMRSGSDERRGFPIPAPRDDSPTADETTVELDMDLVKARMAETAAVSSLLGSIFAEEEPIEHAPVIDAPSNGRLDAAHAGLLRELAKQDEWCRDAFDELAERFDLLPDGALDTLNEASLDAVDDLVCDGEDPIEVRIDIVEAVLE